jgi:integrase/recombinase XerD
VTRLRKMMLEELPASQLLSDHHSQILQVVSDFAKYFGKSPDKLGPNELRTYQAYLLRDRKLAPGSVVNQVAALGFFFMKPLLASGSSHWLLQKFQYFRSKEYVLR